MSLRLTEASRGVMLSRAQCSRTVSLPCAAGCADRHVVGYAGTPVVVTVQNRPTTGPLREQAPCMAMGQAAGTAASLVPAGTGFAEVDLPALRRRLRDQGAIVDYDQAWNDDS